MSAEATSAPAAAARARSRLALSTTAPLVMLALFALLPLLAIATGQTHWLSLINRIVILGIAALSLDLILGVGGLVSFGHAAFIGLGAYTAGVMVDAGRGDLLLVVPAALLVSAVFAALTGAVSLRTKGVAFIMITLAFGQMAFFFSQALYAYGGDDGLTLPERSTVAGFPILANKVTFFYVSLGFLVAAYLLVRAVAGSRFGRALQGARDNPVRVGSFGFDVFRIRLGAYVISGMLAGLSGVLLANQAEFVSPAYMAWQRSGELIFMIIIGGLGSLWGAVLGAAAFLLLEEALSGFSEHWKLGFGVLIVLFVLFTRGGLADLARRLTGGRA
ncbi:branched-chain amino acid ABC transporter permease [Alsobacter metallidurans]|uniref:Branched-chain amino acid ABC transporter permease n=1 Tax=Alsobacter metallidurans TaxID=340221 RepID=A0A917MIU5_9HYPH|nr:branched-chain amino acid ABC transporter permease [Alsobacter metallidurans]GGH22717.1 branched-chain amino acid ABC transporter permease [Alsobacter metallidurans]